MTEALDPAFTLRPYMPGDEMALAALHERVFGRALEPAAWRWKLATRPAPCPNVWLAEAGGEVVFQYAGIPARARLDGREVWLMVSVDTMTHPEFRRRGLLTHVGARVYDAWRAAGVAGVIGLPNEAWGSRAEALGWRTFGDLVWYARVLRPAAVVARRWHVPWLSRMRLVDAQWRRWALRGGREGGIVIPVADAAALGAAASYDPPDRNGFQHDAAWAAWRFLDGPAPGYCVAVVPAVGPESARSGPLPAPSGDATPGCVAWRLAEEEGRIVGYLAGVLAPDTATRALLVRHAVGAMARGDAQLAVALAVPGSAQAHTLTDAGFRRRATGFPLAYVPLQTERWPPAASWDFVGADIDVL